MRKGTITEAEYDWKRGWYAVVDCGGVQYELSHLSDLSVQPGDTVAQGDPVGTVGASGMVSGACLGIRVWQDGQLTDASPLFPH